MVDETTGPEGPAREGVSSPPATQLNSGSPEAPIIDITPSPAAEGALVPSTPATPVRSPQALASRTPPPPPPPPPPAAEPEDEEEEGMLRMSFMDHLEELRTRLLRSIIGVVVAFIAALAFADPLWRIVSAPAVGALKHLGVKPPNLAQLTPMEGFNVIYIKLPLLVSIFIGSPWILYQVWAFISPGLYRREKRWATPFILSTAGLFISGGLFAYFVAFRYGLEFLLGLGLNVNVTPLVSINEYFDLFVNVTLGVGLVFEMPVIIFFLTLLRMASPRFLLKHSRYAILGITILAAIVTPTPDIFNMMIFAVPMVALYFVGLFASYLLILRREGRRFPWGILALMVGGLLVITAAVLAVMIYYYHYHYVPKWPFLIK